MYIYIYIYKYINSLIYMHSKEEFTMNIHNILRICIIKSSLLCLKYHNILRICIVKYRLLWLKYRYIVRIYLYICIHIQYEVITLSLLVECYFSVSNSSIAFFLVDSQCIRWWVFLMAILIGTKKIFSFCCRYH